MSRIKKQRSSAQDAFKNGRRRGEEADFGAKTSSASLPRRLRLLRRIWNSLWAPLIVFILFFNEK